jgi:DNA replication protein DnaC
MDLSPMFAKLIPRINNVWDLYLQLYEGKKNKVLEETLNKVSTNHNLDKSDLERFLKTFDKDKLNQDEYEVIYDFSRILYENMYKDPDLRPQLIGAKIVSIESSLSEIKDLLDFSEEARNKEATKEIDYNAYNDQMLKELTYNIKESIGFYIPLTLTEKALNLSRKYKKNDGNKPILPELALIDHSQMIILGDPGSGKSLLVKQMAIEIISKSNLIPIIIESKYWGFEYNTIAQAIKSVFKSYMIRIEEKMIYEELNRNKYVILIDGFDEIRNAQGKTSFEIEIHSLMKYNNVKLILTSRKAYYHEEFPGLTTFEIDKLRNDQIDEYAKNIMSFEFFSYHLDKLNLLELARLPLYLFMLCKNAADNNKLPENKALLHETFAIDLLKKKRSPTYQPKYPLGLKLMFLEKLAEKRTKDPIYDNYIQCLNEVEPKSHVSIFMQELLDSGILIGDNTNFDFIHPTVREYFYARLISSFESEVILKFLKDHHENEDYLEIILLLVGIQKEFKKQGKMLDFFENNNLPIYIKCLEVRYIHQEDTNNYSEFEYNYLSQLQRSYNSILANFFSSIKFRFYPYSFLPIDKAHLAKELDAQVVGYIDVPHHIITYGYKFSNKSDNLKPLIISKKTLLYKLEDGTPFRKSTRISGLDLDSAREMAIDDIKSELKQIISRRELIHPRDTLELFCEELVADIKAVRSIGMSLKPLCISKYKILDAKEYYDIVNDIKNSLCIKSQVIKILSSDLQDILSRLNYLIKNDISLKEKVLPPYYLKENGLLLGSEMEKRFILRLNKLYSILPQIFSKIVEYNFPELKKYMKYINICPFRCNIRYRYGLDLMKKGLILDPLGEASVYFEPISKGAKMTAIVEKANPDIDEGERIELRKEYTNALKSLGRYSKNNQFRIFTTSPIKISDNLALTKAIYELIIEDLEWFIDDMQI